MIAKRCLVTGRVQGVFYRASTQEHARKLGVTGYAKNLADGRVEVLAIGVPHAVDALVNWLWQGSSASHVTRVDVVDVPSTEIGESRQQFQTK